MRRGNTISAALAQHRGIGKVAATPLITLLYARPLASRQEELYLRGEFVRCLLVACSELYSPSLDAIVARENFVLPITNFRREPCESLSAYGVIRFMAVLENVYTPRPVILMAKNISMVRGTEKTLFLQNLHVADSLLDEAPTLAWKTNFILASQIRRRLQEQAKQQEKQRQQETARRTQKNQAMKAIDEFREQCVLLTEDSLIPDSGTRDLSQPSVSRRGKPRLVDDDDDDDGPSAA